MKLMGVLGGTFDPIHTGHLRLAIEVKERLNLGHLRLIPVGNPNHRGQPTASAALRLSMLRHACDEAASQASVISSGNKSDNARASSSSIIVDDRELEREGVSYMIDTLISLKKDFPNDALCLVVGIDAYAGLAAWHRWKELFDYCHIVVATRPSANRIGSEISDQVLLEFVGDKILQSHEELNQTSHGKIAFVDIPLLEVSSTDIRRRRREGLDISYLVPSSVKKIIEQQSLYES